MLGVEVELAAVFFLAFTIRTILRQVAPGLGLAPRSRTRSVSEWVGARPGSCCSSRPASACCCAAGGGLYLLAIVMIFMCGWNVCNAWVFDRRSIGLRAPNAVESETWKRPANSRTRPNQVAGGKGLAP
jgi:hypothetical protein